MHGKVEWITAAVTAVAVALGIYAVVLEASADEPEPAARAIAAPPAERPEPADRGPAEPAAPERAPRKPRERVEPAESATPPAPKPTLSLEYPDGSYPVIWVRTGRAVQIRTKPGGGELVDLARRRTEFGSPSVFGVVRRQGRWAGVTTPKLPNNQLGWIKLNPRRLKAGSTKFSIVVDLSERRAELRRADGAGRAFTVTVGAPGTDTPTGRFSVTDTFRGGLSPAYGCCAVALSATQPNTPSGWLGGSRIAIHGTTGPLGVAASLGCVRAADVEVSNLVRRVPLGTPVFIRA
jgi:hypothetical protein